MKKLNILAVTLISLLYGYHPCPAADTKAMTDYRANRIADAIYIVEGGSKTQYPYGIKSVKTSNPRKVCINTVKNNYVRWQQKGARGSYLDFLADVYCPKSCDNQGNTNWKKNIHKLVKNE